VEDGFLVLGRLGDRSELLAGEAQHQRHGDHGEDDVEEDEHAQADDETMVVTLFDGETASLAMQPQIAVGRITPMG
jgi:hypothetical protein